MSESNGIVCGEDGVHRCAWGASHADYLPYHDDEWGMPMADDHRLFEKICLEGFQSGLSWLTILRKREAFAGFDFDVVAEFGDADVARLLGDAGIVRHRGKIEATLNNAGRARALRDEVGSLAAYFWSFEPPRRTAPLPWAELRKLGKTPESTALSKDLKKRGWKFVGPTIVYAFMQAMGLVNDHAEGCDAWARVEASAKRFTRPAMEGGR